MSDTIEIIEDLLAKNDPKATFTARQLLMIEAPLSSVIENYLYDNEYRPQKLDAFPMMRQIYDYLPKKVLLKCSRKTLKSTLISNILTINTIRFNAYKQMYVAPQENSAKYFSNNYLAIRFQSPPVRKIIGERWVKNDVFEKILEPSGSSIIFRYASDDATRIRGPAVDSVTYDEIQDIHYDILPVIRETMTMSEYKREIFAGTPLTTTNTINQLWRQTNQLEWLFKCQACNRWNSITEDGEPIKMIQKEGLCCARCGKRISTRNGEWVAYNPQIKDFTGYHLAQPMLPYFNETPSEWQDIHRKVQVYDVRQVYNEVFGLAFDVGAKLITETELRSKCVLGPMYNTTGKNIDRLQIFVKGKGKYCTYTGGVDWGVNLVTSRTAFCLGAMRTDGVYEVFYMTIMTGIDYEQHIIEIARMVNDINAFCASDSGPDPIRGIKLMKLTSEERCQLVRYEHGRFVQRTDVPKESISPTQWRWCLHRSDTIGLTIRQLKAGKILLPNYNDVSQCMQDLLNVNVEIKEGLYREELFYRHEPNCPDDTIHALNFAYCQALLVHKDPLLQGMSTTGGIGQEI